MKRSGKIKIVVKVVKVTFISFGCIFFALLLLAFTSVPFYMYYHLGTAPNRMEKSFSPEHIIMLGGASMPSQGNLIRLFYTAEFAKSDVEIIILHPKDSLCKQAMEQELILKGVQPDRITFLTEGSNTHSQILQLKHEKPELLNRDLLVISSPEHVRRSVKCFNKLGFTSVHGQGAFEATVYFDISLKGKKIEGNEFVPLVESTNLRYTFWNYLKLEIDCFREYTALIYYKLKGWI